MKIDMTNIEQPTIDAIDLGSQFGIEPARVKKLRMTRDNFA